MRPFTKLALIVLFALLLVAAIYQIVIASRDHAPFPGPVEGTPFPTATPTP